MVLLQVVHSIQAVTATVPFSMIMLLDHIKRKTIPAELRVRMIFPTNGLQSVSYWDAPDADALKAWLEEFVGDDCENTISEVQEDFAWGIAAPLGTARGAEGVSHLTAAAASKVGQKAHEYGGAASRKFGELDEKYKLSDHTSKTIAVTKEKASEAGQVIGKYTEKAMQNERVAKTVAGVGSVSSAAWKSVGKGFGFLSKKIGEISETVSTSVQEYNSAETLHGSPSLAARPPAEQEDAAPPMEPSASALSPSFAGFDDDPSEFEATPEAIATSAPEPPAEPKPASPAPAPPAPAYTIDDDSLEGSEHKDDGLAFEDDEGGLAFEADTEALPEALAAQATVADEPEAPATAVPPAPPADLISIDEPAQT